MTLGSLLKEKNQINDDDEKNFLSESEESSDTSDDEEVQVNEGPLTPARKRAKTSTFQDPSFYISTERDPELDFSESKLMVKDDTRNKLEQLMLDIAPDDRESYNMHKRLHRWDKTKKKYVTEFLGDKLKMPKRKRDSAGRRVDTKKSSHFYARWMKRSKRSIASVGETEKHSAISGLQSHHKDAKSLGIRRFKHTMGTDEYKSRQDAQSERKEKNKLFKKRAEKAKRRTQQKSWLHRKKSLAKGKPVRKSKRKGRG